ncbi:MAG: PHB depolymerase family esterase [Bacteroidota bacterium]
MQASHLAGIGTLLFFAFTVWGDYNFSPDTPLNGTPNSIRFEGLERSYTLFEPSGTYEKSSFPLIIVLHGGGSTAKGMVRLTQGRFNNIAEREGAYVVYPEGVRRHWNEGRDLPLSYAHRANVNDVGFIETLVNKLVAEYPVNPNQVFVTGMSDGGLMAYRLACARPDLFAAIAPVNASIPEDLMESCRAAAGTGLMVVNGTADPHMPYDGGTISVFGVERGEVLSTRATVDHWLGINGCPAHSRKKMLPDLSRRDETTVTRYAYSGCQSGVNVALYRVEGGGHTWPGGRQYLREDRIGRTSRDINACDEIWNFFSHFQG